MNTIALQLRRWLGTPRHRLDAERQLAATHRDQAEWHFHNAVRTLEARGHDVAGALRNRTAAQRSLTRLIDSPVSASTTCDRNTPIAVASDLLGMAEHDLRVALRRRAAAADDVAHWRQALKDAAAAERRALTPTTSVLPARA